MGDASKYFDAREFSCPCCGVTPRMNTRLLVCLDVIRDRIGEALLVNSGYRCEKHNDEVGGVKGSAHTMALAADIRSANHSPEEIYKIALALFPHLKGFGLYNTFVHVDAMGNKLRQWDRRSRPGGQDGSS
jgi:uncharacterized protein YcbK (DUF882 family)